LQVFGVGALASRTEYFSLAASRQPLELGLYGASQVLAATPELVASYSSTVLSPRILPAIREGRFQTLFLRTSLACLALASIGAVVGVLLAEPVIRAILPTSYHSAIPVAKILLPGYFATGMLFPLTLSFLVFKKPRIFLLYDALSLPVLAVAYYFAGVRYGAVGVAWLSSASRILKFIVIQILAWRLVRTLHREALQDRPPESPSSGYPPDEPEENAGSCPKRSGPA
jgi:O-antigen/teichoic acid export membrane protein